MAKKTIGCEYCIAKESNNAWKNQPIISKNLISSNINGTFSVDRAERHEGIIARIKDYGDYLPANVDQGYLNHVKHHPAALEIQSDKLGEKVFHSISVNDIFPVIIEIEIQYCPFCGRRLGVS